MSNDRRIIEGMAKISPSLKYVLQGFLVPYSEANIYLATRPFKFLAELEKKSGIKYKTLETAYYRAVKNGLIELDDSDIPRLTEKGHNKLKVYSPKSLGSGAKLLVVFDIAESDRAKRNHLRALLKELKFECVQKSVWMTKYDCIDYLKTEIKEYNLEKDVVVFEAKNIQI